MYEAIKQLAQKYHQETINQRRDFHHFAERGWLEIRTAVSNCNYFRKLRL